jgi:hypothetical protein
MAESLPSISDIPGRSKEKEVEEEIPLMSIEEFTRIAVRLPIEVLERQCDPNREENILNLNDDELYERLLFDDLIDRMPEFGSAIGDPSELVAFLSDAKVVSEFDRFLNISACLREGVEEPPNVQEKADEEVRPSGGVGLPNLNESQISDFNNPVSNLGSSSSIESVENVSQSSASIPFRTLSEFPIEDIDRLYTKEEFMRIVARLSIDVLERQCDPNREQDILKLNDDELYERLLFDDLLDRMPDFSDELGDTSAFLQALLGKDWESENLDPVASEESSHGASQHELEIFTADPVDPFQPSKFDEDEEEAPYDIYEDSLLEQIVSNPSSNVESVNLVGVSHSTSDPNPSPQNDVKDSISVTPPFPVASNEEIPRLSHEEFQRIILGTPYDTLERQCDPNREENILMLNDDELIERLLFEDLLDRMPSPDSRKVD